MDDVRRQLVNAKEIVDIYSSQGRLPPDQARYDLEFLQDRYSHLHASYEDSLASSTFHSHGPSPAPHVVASPGFTPVASMSGSSSLARPRSPYRFSSRSQRYDQRVASSDIPVLGNRPRSRESLQPASPRRPSSQRRSTSRRSSSPRRTPSPAQRRVAPRRTPSPAQRRVAPRRTPSPAQRRVASRRTPSPAQRSSSRRTPSPTQRRVASKGSSPSQCVPVDPTQGSSSAKRPLSGGSQSRRRSSRDSLSPRRGSPPPKRRRYEERLSPLQLTTLHGLPLESPRRKDQGHGLLLSKLPLPERRRKLKTLRFQPR